MDPAGEMDEMLEGPSEFFFRSQVKHVRGPPGKPDSFQVLKSDYIWLYFGFEVRLPLITFRDRSLTTKVNKHTCSVLLSAIVADVVSRRRE